MKPVRLLLPAAMLIALAAGDTPDGSAWRADAAELRAHIETVYAYPERLSGTVRMESEALRRERKSIRIERDLFDYAERASLALADHHATLNRSSAQSFALVPTYADLWIEVRSGSYDITSVRAGSPANEAGIRPGERLLSVDGERIDEAVGTFWRDLGHAPDDERRAYAARLMANGRQGGERLLGIAGADGGERRLRVPTLYDAALPERPAVGVERRAGVPVIRIGNALGDIDTVAAFDAAMMQLRGEAEIVIDLRETPSGGNTTVARGILGWFVDAPTAYQEHRLPEDREPMGIRRSWQELVSPRGEAPYRGCVTVLVGRWTGSMGEGMALGFDAIGADVVGTPMAGLLGAIDQFTLPHSGIGISLPIERLYHVDGTPREEFVPAATASRCPGAAKMDFAF